MPEEQNWVRLKPEEDLLLTNGDGGNKNLGQQSSEPPKPAP